MTRTAFRPTQEQRNNVEAMIGFGIREGDVCKLIINHQTGKPISEPTLRKHFPREIETGQLKANTKVGQTLFQIATECPDMRARMTACIFWMKTRAGWRETSVLQHEGVKDGNPIIIHIDPEDADL